MLDYLTQDISVRVLFSLSCTNHNSGTFELKKKKRWQLCGCGSSCLSMRIQSNQTAPEQLFLLTNTSMFSISNTNFDRWGHSVTRSLKTKFSGTLTPIQTLIRHSCQPEIWIDFILWYLLPNKLSVGICSSFSSPSYLDEKYSWKSRTRFFFCIKKEKADNFTLSARWNCCHLHSLFSLQSRVW